jgi:predicted phage terminase large subunit-like protein
VLEPRREFVGGWVVDAICEHLEAVSAGEIRRLLINVPPGCMKSLTTNVFWPAWEWGPRARPDLRYVSASYSEKLTIRDNRRCRQLLTSDVYREYWGDRFHLVRDQNAKLRYDTNQNGFKIATSVGGVATGERGDRFIIDDPHNVQEGESEAKREAALQWFAETVPTRLNDPDSSAIIVIMQRVHERDVSGLILKKELGYEHLCLPMEYEKLVVRPPTTIGFEDPRREEGELLWEDRFSRRHLEEDLKPALRSWGGDYAIAGQLQQRPTPRGGGLFKRRDFGFVDSPPEHVRSRVRGWDLAGTSAGVNPEAAYTVGAKLSIGLDGRVYVEDVARGQLSPAETEEMIRERARSDGLGVDQDLPQDPGQAGKHQRLVYARLLHGYRVWSSTESGSKEDRARPFAAQVESGNVVLVRGPWNDAYLNEAETFPRGSYKDQIDATSRAYARLVILAGGGVDDIGAPPQVVRVGGREE